MPWTNLPATNATNWPQVDFLNQFREAYNERADLLLGVAGTNNWLIDPVEFVSLVVEKMAVPFAVGDDVQAQNPFSPSILELQTRLEILARYFGAPDLFPVGQQVDITAATANAGLYDLPDWRDDAGIPAAGYTRKFPREIASTGDAGNNGERARHTGDLKFYDHAGGTWTLSSDQSSPADVVEDFGRIEPGDYIGPWIFNELQAGINALEYLRFPVFRTNVFDRSQYDHPHYGAYAMGPYVAELSPGDPDEIGMANAAYAAGVPDYQVDRWVGSMGGLSMDFTFWLPDWIDGGGVRHSRHRFEAKIPDLSLGFEGVADTPGLTREITNLYFYPGVVNGGVFHDFGTGMADAWNDITGDYDPETPPAGESWDASFQWPFATDQTVIPANPVAVAGWPFGSVSGSFKMSYSDGGSRNCFAGYIRFSGFEYE